MATPKPTLALLRTLAGEGDFNLYRMLESGKTGFVFLKCLRTALTYAWRAGRPSAGETVVFVKGDNQLRLYEHQKKSLKAEFGKLEVYTSPRLSANIDQLHLPRFEIQKTILQIFYLLLTLVTGRRRYLNLFLLSFFSAIKMAVDGSLSSARNFICYNDQPFDVAAIISALHQRGNCRTITIQHGLILSEKFYFPTNTQEFWAWGELSRLHFRSRLPDGKFVIKGRYPDDPESKSNTFILPKSADASWKILIAPSHQHNEVKSLVQLIKNNLPKSEASNTHIGIKLHPATKGAPLIRLWLYIFAREITIEHENMEKLCLQYEALFTKNSTSAVDFLLRGKPVAFSEFSENDRFPSEKHGFNTSQLKHLLKRENINTSNSNTERLKFIKDAINV